MFKRQLGLSLEGPWVQLSPTLLPCRRFVLSSTDTEEHLQAVVPRGQNPPHPELVHLSAVSQLDHQLTYTWVWSNVGCWVSTLSCSPHIDDGWNDSRRPPFHQHEPSVHRRRLHAPSPHTNHDHHRPPVCSGWLLTDRTWLDETREPFFVPTHQFGIWYLGISFTSHSEEQIQWCWRMMWWKKRWRSSGEGKVLKAGQNEARGTVATSKAVWSFYHQYMDQWQLSLWAPNPTSVLVTLWCPCRECCGCTAPILEINFKRWRTDNMDLLGRDSKHVRRATVLSIQYRGPSAEVRKPLHLHE